MTRSGLMFHLLLAIYGAVHMLLGVVLGLLVRRGRKTS